MFFFLVFMSTQHFTLISCYYSFSSFLFLPRQLLGGMLTGLKERWQFKSLILWGKLYSIMHYYCSGLGWLKPPTLEVCHLMDCRLTYSFHDFRWELAEGRPLAMRLWTSIFTRKVGRTWPVLMCCYKEGFRRLTQCLILNSQYTIVLIITALVGGKKAHDLFSSNFLSLMKWLVFLIQVPLWHVLLWSGLSRGQFLVAAFHICSVYRRAANQEARSGQIPGPGYIGNMHKIITTSCLQRTVLIV